MPLSQPTVGLLHNNSQWDPEELELNHEAITLLMSEYFRGKAAFVCAGSEDLMALLPRLELNAFDSDVFILMRPYVHSMGLYLANIRGTIHCLLFDPQARGMRYSVTALIITALNQHVASVKIMLSTTQLQPRSISRGCAHYCLAFLHYCATVRAGIFAICEAKEALASNYANAFQLLPSVFQFLQDEWQIEQLIEADLQALDSLVQTTYLTAEKLLDSDKVEATVREMHGIEFGTSLATHSAPSGYDISVDLSQSTVSITLRNARAIYHNFICYSSALFPSQIKKGHCEIRTIFQDVPGLSIDYNNETYTVTCKARDHSSLQTFAHSLREQRPLLYCQHMRQQLALLALADRIESKVELAFICENGSGGFEQRQIQLALQAFFQETAPEVYAPSIEELLGAGARLPLSQLFSQGFQIVVFALHANTDHQVGIWIEINDDRATVTIYDSYVGERYSETEQRLQQLLEGFPYEIAYQESPYLLQDEDDDWSCGVRVITHLREAYSRQKPSEGQKRDLPVFSLAEKYLAEVKYQELQQVKLLTFIPVECKDFLSLSKKEYRYFSYLIGEFWLVLKSIMNKSHFFQKVMRSLCDKNLAEFMAQLGLGREEEYQVSVHYSNTPDLIARLHNYIADLINNHSDYTRSAFRFRQREQQAKSDAAMARTVIIKEKVSNLSIDNVSDELCRRLAANVMAFNFVITYVNHEFLSVFSAEELTKIFESIAELNTPFNTIEDAAVIMKKLPQGARLPFASYCFMSKFAPAFSNLCCFVCALPEPDRFDFSIGFIERFLRLDGSYEELVAFFELINHIPEVHWDHLCSFLESRYYAGFITELSHVINFLLAERDREKRFRKLLFLDVNFLYSIQINAKTAIAFKYMLDIKDIANLCVKLQALSADDSLLTRDGVFWMCEILSEDELLAFLKHYGNDNMASVIRNRNELITLIVFIPERIRFNFLASIDRDHLLVLLADHTDLLIVLGTLQQHEQRALMQSLGLRQPPRIPENYREHSLMHNDTDIGEWCCHYFLAHFTAEVLQEQRAIFQTNMPFPALKKELFFHLTFQELITQCKEQHQESYHKARYNKTIVQFVSVLQLLSRLSLLQGRRDETFNVALSQYIRKHHRGRGPLFFSGGVSSQYDISLFAADLGSIRMGIIMSRFQEFCRALEQGFPSEYKGANQVRNDLLYRLNWRSSPSMVFATP